MGRFAELANAAEVLTDSDANTASVHTDASARPILECSLVGVSESRSNLPTTSRLALIV